MALSARQSRFVSEYATCLSAKRAAELAGYSARTSRQCGSRLLAIPEVMSAIRQEMEQRAEHVEVRAWEVLRELKKIAFSTEERTSDRLKACELLARHMQMFGTEAAVVVGRVTLEQLVPRRKERPPAPPAPAAEEQPAGDGDRSRPHAQPHDWRTC
jgi:phage terminase small subunit